MRRIIVNSTPLIALCNADLLYVLKELYGQIVIPQAVYEEVTEKEDSACLQVKDNLDWIDVLEADKLADRTMYKAKLHKGEVEVMILAKSHPQADLVIIDDYAAKKTAEFIGLKVTGTIGVLLKAKRKGIISSFSEALIKIENNGFYIDQELHDLAVKMAGE